MTLAEKTRIRRSGMKASGKSSGVYLAGPQRPGVTTIKFGDLGDMESYGKFGDSYGEMSGGKMGIAGKGGPVTGEQGSLGAAIAGLVGRSVSRPSKKGAATGASRGLDRQLAEGARGRPDAARRHTVMYAAADALRTASLAPAPGAVSHAASLLHRAAQDAVDRRPRHAAVALAAWEALTCTPDPINTDARRKVLWDVSQLLLTQYVSTDSEMEVLDRMDTVGLERIPPFEQSLVGRAFNRADAEPLR